MKELVNDDQLEPRGILADSLGGDEELIALIEGETCRVAAGHNENQNVVVVPVRKVGSQPCADPSNDAFGVAVEKIEKTSGLSQLLPESSEAKNIWIRSAAIAGRFQGIAKGRDRVRRAGLVRFFDQREIAAKLYVEDVSEHWQAMLDYDKPELDGSEWEPSDLIAESEKGEVA